MNEWRHCGTALATIGLCMLVACTMNPSGDKDDSVRSSKKHTDLVQLPDPIHQGITVEEALKQRRSIRDFADQPISLHALSQLLFAAQGITGESYGTKLRSSPSAGALYPMEIYVFAHSVDNLSPGLFHYDPYKHALRPIKKGIMRDAIEAAGLGQSSLGDAAAVIVCTAIAQRTTAKYGQRGHKYVLIETGHVGQNILLQAVSLGLGAVPVGAFLDHELNDLLGIDGKRESAHYLIAVGKKKTAH